MQELSDALSANNESFQKIKYCFFIQNNFTFIIFLFEYNFIILFDGKEWKIKNRVEKKSNEKSVNKNYFDKKNECALSKSGNGIFVQNS